MTLNGSLTINNSANTHGPKFFNRDVKVSLAVIINACWQLLLAKAEETSFELQRAFTFSHKIILVLIKKNIIQKLHFIFFSE